MNIEEELTQDIKDLESVYRQSVSKYMNDGKNESYEAMIVSFNLLKEAQRKLRELKNP